MIKSNLIELLSTYSPKEIKEFGEYLASPFFNKNEGMVKLYEYIRKFYPKFEGSEMEKENVFAGIFPKVKYNDGFMRTLMFNLNKLAEDFLVYNEFSKSTFEKDKFLLEAYEERKLNKQFEKKLNAVYDKLEKSNDVRNEKFYYKKYIFELTFNRYDKKKMESYLKVKHARYGDIGNESENLIKFFMLALLRRYREMLNRRYVYKIDYNLKFIDELVNHLNENKYDDIPLIEFHVRFIQLMEGIKEDENYPFVKSFLFKNYKIFTQLEVHGLFICLINVITVHHIGDWHRESFEVYNFMLKHNLYSHDETGTINFIDFVSMLFAALRLKEYTWAENFVDKYKKKLEENEKKNAVNFSYARLNFERGDFHKANEYLSKIHFEALYYKIWVKALQIRVFYEMGWIEEALSQIDNFRHFLSSNPMLTQKDIKTYGTFIRFTKRLISIKTYHSKKDVENLIFDIKKEEYVNAREWLLKKIDELS